MFFLSGYFRNEGSYLVDNCWSFVTLVLKLLSHLLTLSLVTGHGEVTYNPRRSFLGAIPIEGKISYHLFSLDLNASAVKLCRKSKWYSSQYGLSESSLNILLFQKIIFLFRKLDYAYLQNTFFPPKF